MAKLRFRGAIEMYGINPFVRVGAERAARIQKDWRKPMPVLVRVNGQPEKPWRINLMPAGDGSFYLYLHGDVRKASGTQTGDSVTVELEFDKSYKNGPMHPMPSWFRAALAKNSPAKKNLGGDESQPQERAVAIFCGIEINGGAGAKSPAIPPRFGRRESAVYGQSLE